MKARAMPKAKQGFNVHFLSTKAIVPEWRAIRKLWQCRLFGRQYGSAGNWREDFEVFRPFFQPTKKPTKLST